MDANVSLSCCKTTNGCHVGIDSGLPAVEASVCLAVGTLRSGVSPAPIKASTPGWCKSAICPEVQRGQVSCKSIDGQCILCFLVRGRLGAPRIGPQGPQRTIRISASKSLRARPLPMCSSLSTFTATAEPHKVAPET